METKPMQFCHRYCRAKKPDLVPSDRDGFVRLLQKIWFDLYRRDGARDSSGFGECTVASMLIDFVCASNSTFFFQFMVNRTCVCRRSQGKHFLSPF